MEEALESIGVMDKKVLSTKRPLSVSFDLEKLRRGLTSAQLAQVIDRLMAQTKNKERKQPEEVVVAPTARVSNKKSKNNKTTKISTKSEKYSKSSKMSSTTSTTTTSKPSTTRTTIKPFNRSKIQSLSLKLSNTAITTTKPKRTKLKVNTIKIRRTTTTTTTPSTTTSTGRTTTKKSKSVRSRKNPLKPTKINSSKASTTSTTTESPKTGLDLEVMKQKIRQKELEFILNKVESLEKQQKRFLKNSNQDLLMESSNRENVVKEPKYEVISFRQKYPEHNPSYSSQHNYDIQDMTQFRQNSENNWQPTPNHSPPVMHLPPPPPPPPPMPNGPPHPMHPPSNGFFSPENMNMDVHQMPHQSNMGPPLPPPPQHFAESQPGPQFHNKPPPELNMHPMSGGHPKDNLFNGVLPIPNRVISLGGADHQSVQESRPMAYQIKQRGHSMQKSEKPGIQLSFGGGPMGGGGQLKTSPMGIFKTLLLPLLPKPRMNLNGKVVFGVVLENGVGFGKKPKIVAQHFSTGRI